MERKWADDVELAFAVISGKVSNAISRNMARQFRSKGIDITPEQWLVLSCLWLRVEGEKPTQNMIAKATFKDRPSITRLIRNLEKQGLVYREEKEGDKRANYVLLTEKGIQLEAKVRELTNQTLASVFNSFTEEEIDNSIKLLGKVFANMH